MLCMSKSIHSRFVFRDFGYKKCCVNNYSLMDSSSVMICRCKQLRKWVLMRIARRWHLKQVAIFYWHAIFEKALLIFWIMFCRRKVRGWIVGCSGIVGFYD